MSFYSLEMKKAAFRLTFNRISNERVHHKNRPLTHNTSLTGVVGVVCGLLLDHHVGWWEPVWVWVGMWVWVGSMAVSVSRPTPVPGPRHVSRPLVQRVQVFLLKALLQVGHAGVRVLPVIPSSTPAASSTSSPTAAMSRWGRWHALKGLPRWWELGAHGVSCRTLIPGTEE